MSGYHEAEIPKGTFGEFSKIEEEFWEAKDAYEQNNPVMLLQELSDMLGAIREYIKTYNLRFEDLMTMTNVTRKVFEEGYRK